MTPNPVRHAQQNESQKIGSPWRTLALCFASLAVMALWPSLGILLMRAQFESASDAYFFFGGVTMFPLMILALFGSVSEEVIIAIFMVVWFAVALLPAIVLRKHLSARWAVGVLLGAQALFSFVQAVMGALLLIGRSV